MDIILFKQYNYLLWCTSSQNKHQLKGKADNLSQSHVKNRLSFFVLFGVFLFLFLRFFFTIFSWVNCVNNGRAIATVHDSMCLLNNR